MAIIDNTLAAQVPQFNLATTLQQGAQAQAAQDAVQAEQIKAKQNAVGAEMRGVAPFVNSPDFPQKWSEAADRLLQQGTIDPQTHQRIANSPSPLMLKSIIAQTDSPEMALKKNEDEQSQKNTTFSQGIQSQQLALQKRTADRADDPTPDGFEANPAFKTDPTAPHYIPLSGGPQDPNYLAQVGKAKGNNPTVVGQGSAIVVPNTGEVKYENKGSTEANMPDETADMLAGRILAGEKGVKTGYGRGAQGPANLMKIDAAVARMAKDQGLTSADLTQRGIDLVGDTSRERTASNMEGKMTPASIEAKGAFKIAREAADDLPRSDFVPYNKLVQMGQAAMSDPRLKKVMVAYNTAVMTYSRAVNPSGVGTVDSQQHAREILQAADGPEATKAAFDQLDREVEMAHASPAQARAGFKKERTERLGKPSAPERFKQLTATGMGKDDAYSKMHEEGY